MPDDASVIQGGPAVLLPRINFAGYEVAAKEFGIDVGIFTPTIDIIHSHAPGNWRAKIRGSLKRFFGAEVRKFVE